MSLTGENGTQLTMPVMPAGGMGGYGMGGFGGDGWWGVLFLIAIMSGGWGGFGGFGGMGGLMGMWPFMFGGFGNGFGGGSASAQGALTRGELCQDMNFQSLENGVRGVQQGLCDGFYAMQGSINGVGATVMQGFSQAELSRAQQQAALMQQLNALGFQQKDCCCETQRSIDNVRFTIAQEDCATRNLMQTNTRDVIENQNNGFRAILDKMCQQELAAKDAKIAEQNQRIFGLELTASQATQNNVIGARIDAATAEILRRTGNDCPVNAYVVQPPQPVSFATNCSGQATFNGSWGNCGNGCNNGCGC